MHYIIIHVHQSLSHTRYNTARTYLVQTKTTTCRHCTVLYSEPRCALYNTVQYLAQPSGGDVGVLGAPVHSAAPAAHIKKRTKKGKIERPVTLPSRHHAIVRQSHCVVCATVPVSCSPSPGLGVHCVAEEASQGEPRQAHP